MNTTDTSNTNHMPEGFAELIPWFAIGKLSMVDKTFFEKALHLYPSLQEQLKQEKQIIEVISADISLLDKSAIAPQEDRLKSVLQYIDSQELPTETMRHNEAELSNSILEKLKNTFDSLIDDLGIKPQYALFASVSVLTLMAAVLSSFIAPSQKNTSEFFPASAATQPTDNQASSVNSSKTILLVGFNGTSEELSSNDALTGKQVKIESPPNKPGFFQISFKDSMTEDEIKQTVEALLAQKEKVWFAGEAF